MGLWANSANAPAPGRAKRSTGRVEVAELSRSPAGQSGRPSRSYVARVAAYRPCCQRRERAAVLWMPTSFSSRVARQHETGRARPWRDSRPPSWGRRRRSSVLLAATALWLVLGPVVGFSNGWLLVPSALASVVALLLVVLLQQSQNRDTRALQLKLDEMIRSIVQALDRAGRTRGALGRGAREDRSGVRGATQKTRQPVKDWAGPAPPKKQPPRIEPRGVVRTKGGKAQVTGPEQTRRCDVSPTV